MRFMVLPLSALHARGPYQYHDLVLGWLSTWSSLAFLYRSAFSGSAG